MRSGIEVAWGMSDLPNSLVVNQELEDAVSIGHLEVDSVFLTDLRAGNWRQISPNVRVKHSKVELEIVKRDGEPRGRVAGRVVGFEGDGVGLRTAGTVVSLCSCD
jgi:hypothetical protein